MSGLTGSRLQKTDFRVVIALVSFFLVQITPLRAAEPSDLPPPGTDFRVDLHQIKKDAEKKVESSYQKLGKPANRDFHSRGVCLKGTFTTLPQNLPAETKVPFFSARATYPVYARFSNGFPGRDSNDHMPSVFGFGLKVIGVPGQKFNMQSLGSTKPLNSNQDWNLATGATFPIPTAAIYRENRELSRLQFARKHPKIALNIFKGLIHLDSFLRMSYHSQAALHFGEAHVAKFSVAPCDGVEKTISLVKSLRRSKTYLTENLIKDVKSNGACFVFRAQIRPADEKLDEARLQWAQLYPKDDPTVLWPTDVIPYVHLAEIKFKPQPRVEKIQDRCEQDLSFNPGNTLQDLRPIETDTLMRARYLAAYEGSVRKRTALNKLRGQSEPAPVPAKDLEKWLAETE